MRKTLCSKILSMLRNMQLSKHFRMISSLLIVMSPLLLWAPVVASNSTKEDIDRDEQERMRVYEAQLLQSINMLCRGEISLPANIRKQLKCRYIDNGNPYLKIAPFKEEEAYLEPRIVIFHDVIYNEEIENLKKLAQPKIKLFNIEADEEKIQLGRIGQFTFLKKDKHEILKVLYRRVEHMTRLSVTTVENVQVFYYRIGGMYLPHYDFALPDDWIGFNNGNRIATVMYYLNDVEEGGRTVFPRLNVSLTPKKGSAVFWYNLTPNGIGDPLTLHAGCPVIKGTKWIANVWLHANGQEFLRLCTLENQPAVDWEKANILF